jgi:hypothetical protein
MNFGKRQEMISSAPGWLWSQLNPNAPEFQLQLAIADAAWDYFHAPAHVDLVEPAEIGRGVLTITAMLWQSGLVHGPDGLTRALAIARDGFDQLFESKINDKNIIAETVRARLRQILPSRPRASYQSPSDKVAALRGAFAGCLEPWNGIELSALADYGEITDTEAIVGIFSDEIILRDTETGDERTLDRAALWEACRPVSYQNVGSWYRQFPSASAIKEAAAQERAQAEVE